MKRYTAPFSALAGLDTGYPSVTGGSIGPCVSIHAAAQNRSLQSGGPLLLTSSGPTHLSFIRLLAMGARVVCSLSAMGIGAKLAHFKLLPATRHQGTYCLRFCPGMTYPAQESNPKAAGNSSLQQLKIWCRRRNRTGHRGFHVRSGGRSHQFPSIPEQSIIGKLKPKLGLSMP